MKSQNEALHPGTASPEKEHSVSELLRKNAELTAKIEKLQKEREHAGQISGQERLILRTLIDNLPDAIYAKDHEGRKIMVNAGDAKNIGRPIEEILGKNDYELFSPELAEHYVADDEVVLKKGESILWREEYVPGDNGDKRWIVTSKLPMKAPDGAIIGLVGIGRDITPLKEAEKRLDAIHKDLVRASRVAGMAEVATSVLHNVGNVLNSINVSASMLLDRLAKLKIGRLTEITKMLRDHKDDLPQFLTSDPRGSHLADFMELLATNLEEERSSLRGEVDQLALKIDHIKQIVAMQQNYAQVAGVVEKVALVDIIEDSLNIHSGAYARHDVTVTREFEIQPMIFVDRHKVLQILGNILSNAKYACDASPKKEKQVTVRTEAAPGNRVRIHITDNGIGITPENLKRIFAQGFTTRKDGHGFGLHGSALAAKEIEGELTVHSNGHDTGATFSLEIPIVDPSAAPAKAEPVA
jgi:PAS domain S-box-containing protein